MSTEREKLTSDISEENMPAVAKLDPKKQRFVHLYLTGNYHLKKISQLLEINQATLSKWLRDDDVQKAIHETQMETHEMVTAQLKQLTLDATEKLKDLINSPIDGVALQAVKDILDRGGHKSKQEIKIDKTVRTFEQKLSDLVERTIVDVDFEVKDE